MERRLSFKEILSLCSDLDELRSLGKIKFEESDIPVCFGKYSKKDLECDDCYLKPACIKELEIIEKGTEKINKGGVRMKESKEQKEKKVKDPTVFDPRPNSLIARVRDAVAKVGWDEKKVVELVSAVEKDEKRIIGRFNALQKISKQKKIAGL